MVSAGWGELVARAAYLLSSHPAERANIPSYSENTQDAVESLQNWYDTSTGLWNTAGWWNSANSMTVLADWAVLDSSGAEDLNIADVMSNTFTKAQRTPAKAQKQISADGLVTTTYEPVKRDSDELETRGFFGFLNEFYDDEGWWALAWIRSWDITRNSVYLDMAESIFEDMKNGTDSICGGGIWVRLFFSLLLPFLAVSGAQT